VSDVDDGPAADSMPSAHDPIAPESLVVDRIVDGRHAVLLIGPQEVEVVIDASLLPVGTHEGDWFRLSFTPDPAVTAARRTDVEQRLARLRAERRGGRFSSEE